MEVSEEGSLGLRQRAARGLDLVAASRSFRNLMFVGIGLGVVGLGLHIVTVSAMEARQGFYNASSTLSKIPDTPGMPGPYAPYWYEQRPIPMQSAVESTNDRPEFSELMDLTVETTDPAEAITRAANNIGADEGKRYRVTVKIERRN